MISFIIVYSTAVWYIDKYVVDVSVPVGIAAVLGTAISILLGFRTNAAYERWWEARKVWGAIVNDSRNLARQIKTFIEPLPENDDTRALKEEMTKRHIAWLWSLNRTLRKLDVFEDLDKYLSSTDELSICCQQQERPQLSDLHTGRRDQATA